MTIKGRASVLLGLLSFFLVGGLEACWCVPSSSCRTTHVHVGRSGTTKMFTMHAATMVSGADAAYAAFFNYMVPLRIGARGRRLPRGINALSLWIYILGGVFLTSRSPSVAAQRRLVRYAKSPPRPTRPGEHRLLRPRSPDPGLSSLISSINFIVHHITCARRGCVCYACPSSPG